MYLNDLQREQLPVDANEKLPLLERLDFIETGQNVVLAGNPGTGKTHIAVGLGLKACLQGYKVLFTSIHRLLTQLRESHSERTLRQLELKFEKYLASYYIDDKAMLPEDFVDLEIREIKTGWSGAKVEKRGDRIFKTHPDSIDAAKWYNMAAPLVNVPIVHSMIGETLSLEYLEDNGAFFKMDEVNEAIDKFAMYKINEPFQKYIDRMAKHVKANNDFQDIIPLLMELNSDDIGLVGSFMHGDLSLENLIQTDKGLYFIDPIYKEDHWSSYLLDISKMLHSYRKYNRMFEYEVFLNTWVKRGEDEYTLRLLEVTQWIRVVKYIPDPIVKKDIHQKTKLLLEEVIKYKK
jgi:thiamine kinase-like enzyme